MRKNFTDRTLQTLAHDGRTVTYFDTNLPSFGFRVGKLRKTFIVMVGKDRRKITLGHYPELTLGEARKRAKQAIGAFLAQETTQPTSRYFSDAFRAFQKHLEGRVKPDTLKQYVQYISQMDFDTLDDITYPAILDALKKWDGKPHAQNYAYSSIRNFIYFCLEHEFIVKNPLFRKKEPNKVKSRDRVLSDEELARVWRCTEDNTYGSILRLLILTGQRRMEVRNLKPTDIQDGLITFNTKGGKQNVIPVTPMMEAELARLPFRFNNWADAKARFDTECGVEFRHHDLRRTLATKWASTLQVPFIIIERLLGHSMNKVAMTYNRHTYIPELRDALLRWEQHISTIVTAK